MSKNEVPRIRFAGCGKCSHTPWEYFARTTGFPSAKYGKNQNFAGFWGYPRPPLYIGCGGALSKGYIHQLCQARRSQAQGGPERVTAPPLAQACLPRRSPRNLETYTCVYKILRKKTLGTWKPTVCCRKFYKNR